MGDDCEECLSPIPVTHYHYEEYEPVLAKSVWEDMLEEANQKVEGSGKIETLEAIKRHQKPRLDGTDWVCDACGSVTADFDLFEEVGAEVNCKSVEEPVAPTPVVGKGTTFTRKPVKTTMSREVMDMYRKMLDDIAAEKRRR